MNSETPNQGERQKIREDQKILSEWEKANKILTVSTAQETPEQSNGLGEAASDRGEAIKNLQQAIEKLRAKIKPELEKALSVHSQIIPIVEELVSLIDPSQPADSEKSSTKDIGKKLDTLNKLTAELIDSCGDHNGSISEKEDRALSNLSTAVVALMHDSGSKNKSLVMLKEYLAITKDLLKTDESIK